MARQSLLRPVGLLVAVGSLFFGSQLTAADAQPSAVNTTAKAAHHAFSAPDGETYFALSLRADATDVGSRVAHDHVVLVDTSASQFGEHRTQSLAVLNSFLAALPDEGRVCLYAVDVESNRLTEGFVSPRGAAIDSAISALNRRFPAGATNLSAALNTGLEQLDGQRAGSLVYIGDGMSAANLLQSDDLRKLVAKLRNSRVPVHSYAVGPNTDLRLLGVIGQHTGGMVMFDSQEEKQDDPSEAGRRLAAAVDLPVFYPEQIRLAADDVELLPTVALPLRSDRETIYLGKGKVPAESPVTVSDEQKTLRWNVAAGPGAGSGNTFLRALWNRAAADRSLSVGLAGMSLFRVAQDDFEHRVDHLTSLGEQAVAVNEFDRAEEIGLAIREIDPNNVRAAALIGAARKKADKIRTVAQVAGQPNEQQPPEPGTQPGLEERVGAPSPEEKDLIEEVQRLRKIREEALRLQVQEAIQIARQMASSRPDEAIALLKQREAAVSVSDIDPDAREQMLATLRSVRQDVISQQEVATMKRIEAQNVIAEREAQQRLIEALEREEEKIKELIDQVRGLMEEGRRGNDDAYEEAEAVARAIVNIRPGNGPAAAALFTSEAAGQLNKAFRLRSLRADRFLETLYQVELSHVPFPDEPPIRWPAAEVWEALTERRKKWASVDLHRSSPAEERIQRALDETTTVEFIDTPLVDAMDFIADLHDIMIILNEPRLLEEGISTDTPITQVLSGISLRSALKIILEPEGLTYVIEDEVMKITTQIDADEKLSTRVYPVGDLVIPIVTPTVGGLGQGFGGVGGIGMGGLGGGQFGAGGVGFGGGGYGGGAGGGLGGGFFSLPPAKIPAGKQVAPAVPKAIPIKDAEIQQLLDGVLESEGPQTSRVDQPVGQAFAQVSDPLPAKPFRFDNAAIESIKDKKKRDRTR